MTTLFLRTATGKPVGSACSPTCATTLATRFTTDTGTPATVTDEKSLAARCDGCGRLLWHA